MKSARALLVAVVVPLIILSVLVMGVIAAGGPMPKETICHFAQHKYVQINISGNAVAAHMRHGDVTPDEYGNCP